MMKKTTASGFTLLEILFTLGIFLGLLWVLGNFQVNVFSENTAIGNSLTAESEARLSLKKTIAELRAAVQSELGGYPIALATGSSLTYYSDADGDGAAEQYRYFLNGSTLQKGKIIPTGSPLAYVSGNERITTEISHLTNINGLFTYFDAAGGQLPEPINLPNVRLIKIIYTIDADPNRPPGPITLGSQVSVRSLKY